MDCVMKLTLFNWHYNRGSVHTARYNRLILDADGDVSEVAPQLYHIMLRRGHRARHTKQHRKYNEKKISSSERSSERNLWLDAV